MKPGTLPVIVTRSERMRSLLDQLPVLAASEGSILLLGETGVGKELFADHIHRLSPRRDGPFVKISLSAMPHDLLESELFGHERGAFTTAVQAKKGLFELASGGTIFLDDVDDVPPAVQPKLLRALEAQEVMRVGGTVTIPFNTRLVSAAKVDLKQLVERGLFRADLYYRLHVVPVRIPPLRERPEDVSVLLEHFLLRYAPGRELRVNSQAAAALSRYSWPGNVRELRNVAHRLTLFAGKEVRLEDLPPEILEGQPAEVLARACVRCIAEKNLSFNQAIDCLEETLLKEALRDAAGNRSQAARVLGLSLSTFRDKLKKYGLES
ncbi:MAG: sigma-54-dependent Fis family transcriptional regulator [Acidobacteria bacterium]|nr:sigma-54-dependent Fis family transcriptional regulator [Acidobacteriota bacterium]MCG3191624.1 DNA-binding transcriptional regulator NtrC [Thermoanaerobaculia bacterium]MCK6683851.1 sigma-54 dependent transcriptional regulator [Thermoanaerobaculia bacterium]